MAVQAAPAAKKNISFVSGETRIGGSLKAMREDRLAHYLKVQRECDGIGAIHWGVFPMVVVSKPEYVQSILVEQSDAFYKGLAINLIFGPIVGKGLFLSEGDQWRKQRKTIAPLFQPRHLANYADTIVSFTERQVTGWQEGAILDAEKEMVALTMSIIGKILFDEDVFGETDVLGSAIGDAFRWLDKASTRSFPIPNFVPTPSNVWMRRRWTVVQNRIKAMIDERRANPKERVDILSMLLNATDDNGNHMDDIQARDEALTVFGAGHETTAVTLSWALYFMLAQPDIYARMQQEVDTILEGRAPTVADLPRLPYILQFIKETLRYYPAPSAVSRQALRDVQVGDYTFRKNTIILLPIYATHHLPEYYPDPERFDPERFSPVNEKKIPRYAYWPFGAGPRVCVGSHLAMMEMHLVLARLLQQVRLELVPNQDVQVEMRGTIHMNGCKIIVHHR